MSAHDFYRWMLQPGDLVFDIGAFCGDYTTTFLDLGCRVVAVEPNPAVATGIPATAYVEEAAVGAEEGEAVMRVPSRQPYLATIDPAFPTNVLAHGPVEFDREATVRVTTLDRLIGIYGEPRYCKIDVEGHEAEVLAGLSHPLPLLSFEVHSFDLAKAERCMERLALLGTYQYRYSDRETFVFQSWPAEVGMYGDVYAVRVAEL